MFSIRYIEETRDPVMLRVLVKFFDANRLCLAGNADFA